MRLRSAPLALIVAASLASGCASILGLPDEYEEGSAVDSGYDASTNPDSSSDAAQDADAALDSSVDADASVDLDASAEADAAVELESSVDAETEAEADAAHDATVQDADAAQDAPVQDADAAQDAPVQDADAAPDTPVLAGLSVGRNFACAIVKSEQSKSRVHCWGECGGQLGYDCSGTPTGTVASPVEGKFGVRLEGVTAVSAGGAAACALMDGGQVQCWGNCGYGALGRGCDSGSFPSADAVQLEGGGTLESVLRIASFGERHCVTDTSRRALCWGEDELDPATTHTRATVRQTFSQDLTEISVGGGHVCVIDSNGTTLCWGQNGNRQVNAEDAGTVVATPLPVPIGSSVLDVALGYQHSCAIRQAAGEIFCWGAWRTGVPEPLSLVPKQAAPYASLASGYWHMCALTPEGKVMCFGQSASLWKGDAVDPTYQVPYLVQDESNADLIGMKWLGASDKFACAASETAAYCWGDLGYDVPGPYHCLSDGGVDPLCWPRARKIAGLPLP